jgi:hypothetical protein
MMAGQGQPPDRTGGPAMDKKAKTPKKPKTANKVKGPSKTT